MDTLFKDIRYSIRSLLKRRGFTAIAALTLALGIGASTAIFSVVDGVLLRSLPYPNADQIVQLREVSQRGGRMAFAEPNFLDVRARSHSFESVAQYAGELTTVTGAMEPVRVPTFHVSSDFFNVLGMNPVVGRTFLPEESKPGGAPVAVISYGFWQRLLGGRPDLSGTTLRMMDQSVSVVGWGVDLLLSLNQQSLPRINEIGVNTRAITFTLGLSLLIGIVLGLVPLLRFSGKDLERTLRESGAGARGYAGQRLRGLLVVGQMALTLMLLVGAGLLGKSFYRLLQVDPGFQTESVVAMELSLPNPPMDEQRYVHLMKAYDDLQRGIVPEAKIQFTAEEERQRLFQKQLLERLSTTPGVIAIGSISHLPLTGGGPDGTFLIGNNPARKGNADYRRASAGYFAAMKIPLLRGRTFDSSDEVNSLNVAVISQSLAQKYWPNEDPIGQTIQFGNMDGDLRLLHIVGVVGDVSDYGVDEAVAPTVYANSLQRLPTSSWTVVVRGQADPATLTPSMREAVRSLDSQLPLKFRTLDQVFSSSLDQRRFSLVIFGFFGTTALLLAAMGIYGVTAYTVAQRTQEIGLRIALGAQMSDVLSLMLRKAMSLVLVGAIIGIAGAYAVTRVMSNLLFGVTPTDLATFIAVPLVLLLVALLACLIPARRATKVDPLIALRYE